MLRFSMENCTLFQLTKYEDEWYMRMVISRVLFLFLKNWSEIIGESEKS